MCNACGFSCCAFDGFSGCGCDGCHEPACWTECDPANNIHGEDCDCPDEFFAEPLCGVRLGEGDTCEFVAGHDGLHGVWVPE